MANLFQTRHINNKTTKNSNRFTIQFVGLSTLIDSALKSDHPGFLSFKERAKALAPAIGGDAESGNRKLGELLQLSLLSTSIPNLGVETTRVQRFNDSIVATTKFSEPEDLTVSFYDYVNGSASAVMSLWQSLVADKRTGAMGFKENFVLPFAYIKVFGPDAPAFENDNGETVSENGDDGWIEIHEVRNLFPKSVNLGEHSYDTGEPRKVECTFTIDNIYPIGYRAYSNKLKQLTNNVVFGALGDAPSAVKGDDEAGEAALKTLKSAI